MSKPFTVRLPQEHIIELETLATYDGVAIAEEIREAVELLIAKRHGDEDFRRRVRETYDRAHDLLSRLDGAEKVSHALGRPDDVLASVSGPAAQRTQAARPVGNRRRRRASA